MTAILFLSLNAYSQEVAQCEIGIDLDNTSVSKIGQNLYRVKAVIHHPHGGNDDSARDVHINVTIPVRAIPLKSETRISKNDDPIDGSWNGTYFIAKVDQLDRREFIEIDLQFKFACNPNHDEDQVTINAWSARPNDINGDNNTWRRRFQCR